MKNNYMFGNIISVIQKIYFYFIKVEWPLDENQLNKIQRVLSCTRLLYQEIKNLAML